MPLNIISSEKTERTNQASNSERAINPVSAPVLLSQTVSKEENLPDWIQLCWFLTERTET